VDESLLHEARASGITPELSRRLAQTIGAAIADGAAVVACTCSTIGGCAEQANQGMEQRVVRIDRAMAEQAVASGERIIIAAALASTLIPTRQLILDVAAQAGKAVDLVEVLCEDAWPHFERGEHSTYFALIARRLRQVTPAADVVVLAQASMAGAAAFCADLSIPILSSPRLGLAAAIQAYRILAEASNNELEG
jgi:hypothetical protein